MSSFTSLLLVSPLSDGRNWRLIRSFTYRIGSKYSRRYIKVPRGFVTDFASIPRFLFFLSDWATYSKAPVLHDYLYQRKEINGVSVSRKESDDIFLEAMKVDWRNHKSRYIVATIEYVAVRLFGLLAWRNERR